jgi:hypothetical protein
MRRTTMRAETEIEYKAALRDFMQRKGQPMHFEEGYDGTPRVSTYGWSNWEPTEHCTPFNSKYNTGGGCSWVVPEGAVLTEETYSMFAGTFTGNDEEVGINVSGCRCACGKYTDVTLRYTGSLGSVLTEIFGKPTKKPGIVL